MPSALLPPFTPVALELTFAIIIAFASTIGGAANSIHDQPAVQAIRGPLDRCYRSPSSRRDGDFESLPTISS